MKAAGDHEQARARRPDPRLRTAGSRHGTHRTLASMIAKAATKSAGGSAPAPALPKVFRRWFAARGWQPHAHQYDMLAAAGAGRSVLLVAPTGGGKTLAGFLPSLVALAERPMTGLHT